MTHHHEDNEFVIPQTLFEVLELNYKCLNRKYRAGGFEDIVGEISVDGDDQNLTLFSDEPKELSSLPDDRKITFQKAIRKLWELTQREEANGESTVPKRELTLLRCRILIYEAMDYFLEQDERLEAYFIDYADHFPYTLEELEPRSVALQGGPFPDKNSRAKVVKVQLIAALSGVNALYRLHARSDAQRVQHILERLTDFIEHTLPDLHENPRPSWGLLGITFYLQGRLLSSLDRFDESRKAFRKSSDAYLARLRQKEDFLEKGYFTLAEYKEKVSLTIRRSALVTAFGDGYLSFVASRIADALESLTVARAALAQNSGKVYITYVDMLYFASLCAQHSSDREKLETVINGLRRCYDNFGKLVCESHYYHRAGLRLATALFYRAQLSPGASDQDLLDAFGYIDKAKDYAVEKRNKHLLSTALVAESRLEMSRPSGLKKAAELASQAADEGAGYIEKELEAITTLGEIHLCLAELNKEDKEKFKQHSRSAQAFFRDALTKNRDSVNIRIEAVCVLQLARLFLLDEKTEALAFQYFEHWKRIESGVEHEYCKALARELEPRLNVPFFFLNATQIGEKNWELSLGEFLNDHVLKQFVATYNEETDRKTVKKNLIPYLMKTLHLSRSAIYKRISEDNEALLDKVMEMLGVPDSSNEADAPDSAPSPQEKNL